MARVRHIAVGAVVAGVLAWAIGPTNPREVTGDSTPVTEPSTTMTSPSTTTVPSTDPSITTLAPTTTTTTTTVPLRAKDVRVLYRLPVKSNVVFITIDDGGYISPDLVRYLNANRIPVTSFVMPGPMVWQWSKFRQIRAMSFENHTNTHAHLRRLDFAHQKAEICRARDIIRHWAHRKSILFRPPGGDWNYTTKRAAAACGYRYLVMWNVIADNHYIRMRKSLKLAPGDIILMHYKSTLLSSLKWVLAQARHDGLRPALLRDYVRYKK